ncbi:hypothetical protein DPMN_078736 [Dreissena polymorpha]|uniref:Uncharacterized protein n=1 Tax=Dreissena polymorpha TaxID=45954 RepID=A0A9D3YMT0_DREPO|nr:hypothetical protein DPMN_078736 [Dreissena polymorpha]
MASTSETSVELKIPPSPAIPERDDTGQSSETQLTTVVRQIPDNQEVFVHPGTDQSIIIEPMEAVDSQQPDEHAISTHFEDLETTNGAAADSNIVRLEQIQIENISLKESSVPKTETFMIYKVIPRM